MGQDGYDLSKERHVGPIVRKYWVKQGRKKHSRASLSPTELHN